MKNKEFTTKIKYSVISSDGKEKELEFDELVDMKNLFKISEGLKMLCLEDYDHLIFNKNENTILVILSNTFIFTDINKLEDWIRYNCIIQKEYQKNFSIYIQDEYTLEDSRDWYKFDENGNIVSY